MSVPVLAIVGFSNSGKTTLIEKLISMLSAQGLRVCSIKHSHHQVELDRQGKDSWRHKHAGAQGTILLGPEQMMLVQDVQQALTPQKIADMYFPDADLVLVEGFASMPCDKIEVVRAARSTQLCCQPDSLLAVVTDVPELPVQLPNFALNDVTALTQWLCDWIEHD